MTEPSHGSNPARRLALSFADGSFSVFPSDANFAQVREQRDGDDERETDIDFLTDIVTVELAVVEVMDRRRGVQPKIESRAIMALRAELHWHESEDKALSKSGRNDADAVWRRDQHRERMEALRATLAELQASS